MKKNYILIGLISLIFIGGCNNKDALKELQTQNQILQEQLETQKKKDALEELQTQNQILQKQLEAQKKEDFFQKNQECQKYKSEIEKKYKGASVNVFFSPHYNTCVSEQTSIINGAIISQSILDVFSNKGYVIKQDGQVIYDEKELGPGKTYGEIKEIIKGE